MTSFLHLQRKEAEKVTESEEAGWNFPVLINRTNQVAKRHHHGNGLLCLPCDYSNLAQGPGHKLHASSLAATFLLPLKASRRLAGAQLLGLELDLPYPHEEPAGSCLNLRKPGKLAAKDVVIATAFLSPLLGVSICCLCSSRTLAKAERVSAILC